MPSINYEEIYSKFRLKADAYDLLDLREDDVNMFMCEWLHSSTQKPYIYRLFNQVEFHDDIQKLEYSMKYVVEKYFDQGFVSDILGIGMVIEWITPKIVNLNNIVQVHASSNEKFYSQASHLNGLKDLRASLVKEQQDIIKQRGCIWNSYLAGNS